MGIKDKVEPRKLLQPNDWNDLNGLNFWNLLLQREAREEIPHFAVGVDDIGRPGEETFHHFLFTAGPDVAGTGEFPQNNFHAVAAT